MSAFDDILSGLAKSQTTDFLGAPVDLMQSLVNLGLAGGGTAAHKLGLISASQLPKPLEGGVGTSDWWAQKMGNPNSGSGPEDAARIAGGLANPLTAGKALGGLASKAMILAATGIRDTDKAARLMKTMEEMGIPFNEANARAFAATGVYHTPGDVPKTILSDKGAVYSPPKDVTTDASEVLSHPDLYKQHPKLGTAFVVNDPGLPVDGAFFNAGPRPLTPHVIEMGPTSSPETARNILLHELQHGAQAESGFAGRGTNMDVFRKYPSNAANKLGELIRQNNSGEVPLPEAEITALDNFRNRVNADNLQAFTRYQNNPGEQEARFTEKTSNLSQEELAQEVLKLLRQGKSPSSWDTKPLVGLAGAR